MVSLATSSADCLAKPRKVTSQHTLERVRKNQRRHRERRRDHIVALERDLIETRQNLRSHQEQVVALKGQLDGCQCWHRSRGITSTQGFKIRDPALTGSPPLPNENVETLFSTSHANMRSGEVINVSSLSRVAAESVELGTSTLQDGYRFDDVDAAPGELFVTPTFKESCIFTTDLELQAGSAPRPHVSPFLEASSSQLSGITHEQGLTTKPPIGFFERRKSPSRPEASVILSNCSHPLVDSPFLGYTQTQEEQNPYFIASTLLGQVSSIVTVSDSASQNSISEPIASTDNYHGTYNAPESTMLCRQAYQLVSAQNFKGLSQHEVVSWLWSGFRWQETRQISQNISVEAWMGECCGETKEDEGCRVETTLLFGLLAFISDL